MAATPAIAQAVVGVVAAAPTLVAPVVGVVGLAGPGGPSAPNVPVPAPTARRHPRLRARLAGRLFDPDPRATQRPASTREVRGCEGVRV